MNKKNNIKQSLVDNKGKEADSLKLCSQEELCSYLKKIIDDTKILIYDGKSNQVFI